MPLDRSASRPDVEMCEESVAAFLQSHGDGVLTLHGDSPTSLPVSYGFDADTGRCIFQFLSHPASEKRAELDDQTPATLVAYDVTDPDDWTSVVFDGVLEAVPIPCEGKRETYVDQATPIGMSVFDAVESDLDAAWFELRPTEVSGRQSPTDGSGPRSPTDGSGPRSPTDVSGAQSPR
jgi:nitroimidazol reductase NimA-like FMN-containing flavoprotein (pyridoxamine 5'-phosphate oxidase superfamily)